LDVPRTTAGLCFVRSTPSRSVAPATGCDQQARLLSRREERRVGDALVVRLTRNRERAFPDAAGRSAGVSDFGALSGRPSALNRSAGPRQRSTASVIVNGHLRCDLAPVDQHFERPM